MDMGTIFGKMGDLIRVIQNKINFMEKELIPGQMVEFMKDLMQWERSKDMVFINGPMVGFIKVNGKMDFKVDKDWQYMLMDENKKGYGVKGNQQIYDYNCLTQNIYIDHLQLQYITTLTRQQMNKISQGFFSQPTTIAQKKQYPDTAEKKQKENIEPNKRVMLQNESNIKLSYNTGKKPKQDEIQDRTNRSVSKRLQMKELTQQIQKLKNENKKLKQKLKNFEKQQENKNTEILQYEMYFKQIQQSISLERAKFKTQLKDLKSELSKFISVEKQNQRILQEISHLKSQLSHKENQSYHYQKILRQTILFLMSSFSQVTNIKQLILSQYGHIQTSVDFLEKNFVKIFKLLNPLIQQWNIEKQLHLLKQKESQQEKISLIQLKQLQTLRSSSNPLQDTFQAKQIQTAASTIKELDNEFIQKYVEHTYVYASDQYQSENQNHLRLEKGSKIKLLKKNLKSNLWIGELDDKIGYFPANILE